MQAYCQGIKNKKKDHPFFRFVQTSFINIFCASGSMSDLIIFTISITVLVLPVLCTIPSFLCQLTSPRSSNFVIAVSASFISKPRTCATFFVSAGSILKTLIYLNAVSSTLILIASVISSGTVTLFLILPSCLR